ncbi:MAG: hypothetical protein ACE5Q6_09915 [Dehalococcoidia bacterium]
MTDQPARCEACGREFEENGSGLENMPVIPNPHYDGPKNYVERSLKEHLELLDRLSRQLDQLLAAVQGGTAGNEQVIEGLETLRETLRPRHGLCIDPKCAPCRVHEEVIKEHVMLYIDWKVPGTVQKLQQTRHRN